MREKPKFSRNLVMPVTAVTNPPQVAIMTQNDTQALVYRRSEKPRKSADSCLTENNNSNEHKIPFLKFLVETAWKSGTNYYSVTKKNSRFLLARKKFLLPSFGRDPHKVFQRDNGVLILHSQGLLSKKFSKKRKGSPFVDVALWRKKIYRSVKCKACVGSDRTPDVMVCDGCSGAFHDSCCSLYEKKIPVGEWQCGSCWENAPGNNMRPLEIMLRDSEMYMNDSRVGSEFQADVPKWDGPVREENDDWWLTMDPPNDISCKVPVYNKPSNQKSISNWLQCQEPIEGSGDGKPKLICGKWRRAPASEVQTDKWVCFSCILWDPSHADCAVPQELDTEEVMKQLKYMEKEKEKEKKLKPKVATKKRKLDNSKSVGSLQIKSKK